MMSCQGRQFKGENRRCKGSDTLRAQLFDDRDNFPKISVLLICLGYVLSRFKKAVILSHLKGFEILRSSFCEQVIRHDSEKIVSVLQSPGKHCSVKKKHYSTLVHEKKDKLRTLLKVTQMLIFLRNCLLYTFYGIGDIHCIGDYLQLYVLVNPFSGIKHCTHCDVLKVTLCLRCHFISSLSFYDIQQKYLRNIEEKNNDIDGDVFSLS